jgi:hypothetical protein
MRSAPDRDAALRRRWQAEVRALATVLAELEANRDLVQRDLAFHRMVGELRADLDQRCSELRAECDRAATELTRARLELASL